MARHAYSAPMGESINESVSKRATTGPKLDGANFPGIMFVVYSSSIQLIIRLDPSIIHTDKWYSFATRTIGSSIHVQIATSIDFNTWSIVKNNDGSQKDALPDLPAWVANKTSGASNVWAPDVNKLVGIDLYPRLLTCAESFRTMGATSCTTVRAQRPMLQSIV